MRISVASSLVALAVGAAAQNFTIDPTSVPLSTRSSWCAGEQNTCTTLCSDNPTANSCDPSSLNFTCLCSNNSAPGLQYYLQTMPTFICEEAFSQCIEANAGQSQAQTKCKTDIEAKCGKIDATNATFSSGGSSTTSTSASSSPKGSATATSAAPTTSASKAAGAVPTAALGHLGNGAAAVAVGIFAYLL